MVPFMVSVYSQILNELKLFFAVDASIKQQAFMLQVLEKQHDGVILVKNAREGCADVALGQRVLFNNKAF